MAKQKTWKKGDKAWRGYARIYLEGSDVWWPEIRPATVVDVAKDGTLRLHMEGPMPGAERKRNPGTWMAWDFDPNNLFSTPEEALRVAKRTAVNANVDAAAKAA